MIQTSKTAKSDTNALYFIDFWATWCGPCIHVKKYLGSLQRQYPNDFYIISISEENPIKVKRFLENRPTDLAVAIDYNGETFTKNNIRTLPQGILINAKGQVLWEGHSAEFKTAHIDKFLRENKTKKKLSSLFKVKQDAQKVVKPDYIPRKSFELKRLNDELTEGVSVKDNFGYLELKGSLQTILAYTAKIYKEQINVPKELNLSYQLYVKKDSEYFADISSSILNELKLDFIQSESKGNVYVLNMENPKFWDTYQIEWGKNNVAYLIDDSQIQADNVTLKDITFTLATVLDEPVVVKPYNFNDDDKHDWQIHYKFFNLMKSDLMDNYGIRIEKQEEEYPIYKITKAKKAP